MLEKDGNIHSELVSFLENHECKDSGLGLLVFVINLLLFIFLKNYGTHRCI